MVWGLPRCVWARESTAPAQGNQCLSRELRALQYSCLENPRDRGAWWAAVHGVAKSRIQLSVFTFTFHFHALEKEMATHSSVLAWRIPGTVERDGLPSMGSHRVGHPQLGIVFALAPSVILSGVISPLISISILDTY